MHRHVQQLLATRVICVCERERLILLARSRTRIFFFYFSASRHACDVRVRVCERRASHARACVCHYTSVRACAKGERAG